MKTKLIGLLGQAGSGKDTVADMICELTLGSYVNLTLGSYVNRLALASPIKAFCSKVLDFTDVQLWGPSEERNKPDPRYIRADGVPLTPRHALQQLGTEWGRACHPNIWIDYAIRQAETSDAFITLITDCRFVNEAKAIRAAGGEVWRIVRPAATLAAIAGGDHASEREMQSFSMAALVTREIDNSVSLADLHAHVRAALVLSGLV
jgi:hypothetical protein